jgi:hypothetical protein
MHMTADKSKGVIVWAEGSVIRRLDFTVDESGDLQAGQPVTILPRSGEEPLPGDSLNYTVWDVWGDAAHDSLYIAVMQLESFNSGPDAGAGTRVGSIYDLNTLAEYKFFDQFIPGEGTQESFDWLDAGDPSTLPDCYSVPYPQFVPTCYKVRNMKFNPSGTRLYLERNLQTDLRSEGEVYRGFMRINTEDMAAGLALSAWDLAGPEMVFASEAGLEGLLPRPDTDPYGLPDPEIVASGEYFLDADACAIDYAPFADGNSEPQSSIWQGCIVPGLIGHTGFGGGQVWESADTYLFNRTANRGRQDIYRFYIRGPSAGTEELLFEDGGGIDTGL